MIRDILASEKVNTALGAAYVTFWVALTLWLLVAVVTGSVVILRAIERAA